MIEKIFRPKRIRPKQDTYEGFQEGEKIILFLRRHWLAMLPVVLAVLFLMLIPLVVLVSIYSQGWLNFAYEMDLGISVTKIVVFLFFVYLLFLVFFILVAWLQYYLDVTILTNRRLIDIQQINIFNRQVAFTDLVYIQDVRSEIKGFIQRFFDYGTVMIQTAAENPNFILRDMPHPSMIAREIIAICRGEMPVAQETGVSLEQRFRMHEDEALRGSKENLARSKKTKKEIFQANKIKRKEKSQKKIEKIDESGEITLS